MGCSHALKTSNKTGEQYCTVCLNVLEPSMINKGSMQVRRMRHLISFIRYVPGVPYEEAPMECVCGWGGIAQDWHAHRGAKHASDRFVQMKDVS